MATKDYETLFILRSDLSEEETDAEIAKVTDLITGKGGVIIEEEKQGKRRLAYPIRKQRYGFYSLIRFSLEPAGLKDLEKLYRFNENCLKNIILLFDGATGRKPVAVTEETDSPSEDNKDG